MFIPDESRTNTFTPDKNCARQTKSSGGLKPYNRHGEFIFLFYFFLLACCQKDNAQLLKEGKSIMEWGRGGGG